jgi:hypothetical protein
MGESQQISRGQGFISPSRTIAAACTFISALQGFFFVLERPWTIYNVVGMCLAASAFLFAWRYLTTNKPRFLGLILFLLGVQFILFVAVLARTEPPFPCRLLQVAILVSYFTTATSALLAGTKIIAPINAILLSFSIAVGIFVAETTLELLLPPVKSVSPGVEWSGKMQPHSRLGMVYQPYSVMKTYYPDNPRGYFEEEDKEENKWQLRVAGGNEADMDISLTKSETVRIAITRVETNTGFDIQLNLPRLKVKSNHHYTVNFQARADKPRNIVVGFAKAHAPWTGLGLYSRIELTPKWQSFQENFTAKEDDDNARIHFDLGGSDISVEVSKVNLRTLPDDQFIEPELPPKRYFVSYKFNALGCRGRDYALPRPKGTMRIIALGDSFTMGVGVNEEDTFTNQLERLLNEKAASSGSSKINEVINCGVSGFGTKEERLLYELTVGRYEPDIVLLMMVWNDDLSYLEELQRGYVDRRPGPFEKLFYTWGKIQEYRHQRRTFDYSKCVEEILQLDSQVRKQGARLVVAIFRTDDGKEWEQLTNTVTKGLRDTDIPILDLGKALLNKHTYDEIIVHKVDAHPNEIAHKMAAQEMSRFLQRAWSGSQSPSAPNDDGPKFQ